jgi:uncharacterized protein (DUF302 family)
MAADGLITLASGLAPKETADRLAAAIEARGMTVFARIDHAAGAAAAGLALRPTELLVFGNARSGTPLMQADQAIGIDLPLKAVVYEDAAGKIPACLQRSALAGAALGAAFAPIIEAMATALAAVAAATTRSSDHEPEPLR